jgi:hypothetical protein
MMHQKEVSCSAENPQMPLLTRRANVHIFAIFKTCHCLFTIEAYVNETLIAWQRVGHGCAMLAFLCYRAFILIITT